MKIVINSAHQRFGGGVQVALSFLNECKSHTEHEFVVWAGPGLKNTLDESDFPSHFSFHYFDFGTINFKQARRINQTLQERERQENPDVIIATSGPSYFHSKAPQIIGFNLPLYIYPETPFLKILSRFKKWKLALRKRIHFFYFRRDAAAYVVQTDDVNQRVRTALKTDKVFTVTNTCSSVFRNPQQFPTKLPVNKSETFRFVTISSYYQHKDLEIIPKVQHRLKSLGYMNVEFVLTLNDVDFKNHIGSHDGIINIGPIKPAECPSLYAECDGMFLPTLAECFSAAYPEAMIMRKPIVTSDLGFAKSICGEAALYYRPMDADAATTKIIQILNEPLLREQLVKKGLAELNKFDTPAERANKYLDLCVHYARTKKIEAV